nr:glutamate 5-kinase [Desulfobacterales bacterium]
MAGRDYLEIRREFFKNVRRVVIKIGSGVLTEAHGLNLKVMDNIVKDVCDLKKDGLQIILVSSGAVASGIKKMRLSERPCNIPQKQAVASIGQCHLILEYERCFEKYQQGVAQILLTRDDLMSRTRYLNARNTLNTLLKWNIVPIINENDTVVVEELKFGDNDSLSALIAHLMDAEMLINLTDIDGLFDKDPRVSPGAELIRVVEDISPKIERAARSIPGALGTGGMLSKVMAARIVSTSGIPMVIANGLKEGILKRLFEGEEVGTFFLPKKQKLAKRKCWIAFTQKIEGVVVVDDGASEAILNKGKSLLPSGILDVQGEFGVGSAVRCERDDGTLIAIGLVNYGDSDIRRIKGLKTSEIKQRLGFKHYDEVIHRDNLVLMTGQEYLVKG